MNLDLSRFLRPLAWASIVANIGIVVTGGAVRLTASGLGCPDWPHCSEGKFVPHGSLGMHGAIEFGNRLLTFVLAAIAILTLISAWQSGRRGLRTLALMLAIGIPAQAVIGGITVLTDLNPWIVAFHLLCSMAMIGVAVLLLRRIDQPDPVVDHGPLVALAWLMFAAGWVVLYLGTVVTGSGPHAGDIDAPRNGLDPVQVSQLHADSVFLFIGLTLGLMLAVGAARPGAAGAEARRAAWVLLIVELAQGAIGFVQYFTDLPEILVGTHMLGAGLISATMTWALLTVRTPARSVPVDDRTRLAGSRQIG